MAKIVELSKELVEQIAAGEVVENPSSVIKELVENAIDAGANKIFIEVEEGGKSLIRVTDDGCGMSKDDVLLATKRHATSKIHQLADLFNIETLGFRGEALAAISAVSEFELVTKTQYSMEGYKLHFEEGEPVVESVACPQGTTILVKNLFYNTPGRKKHLRPSSFEFGKIVTIVTKYALANPLIYFKLVHDGKEVLNSPNSPSMQNNIVDIYGTDIAKQLLKIEYRDSLYSIKGYISKPSFSRSDKDLINIFVNKRYVKNPTIIDAVYDAYHTLLHSQRYPFALLLITVAPKRLDVNIHPAKTKIKVEQEGKLYEIIFDLVRNTLKEHNILAKKESEERAETLQQERLSDSESVSQKTSSTNHERKYSVEQFEQKELEQQSVAYTASTSMGRSSVDDLKAVEPSESDKPSASIPVHTSVFQRPMSPAHFETTKTTETKNGITETKTVLDTSISKNKIKILGQIYKTYILVETQKGLAILDQHAAHERILFDKLIAQSRNMMFGKQELLSPVKINLGVRETSTLEENKAFLRQIGFELENFGGGMYLLRSIPVVLKKHADADVLLDLLAEILSHGKVSALDKMKHEVFSSIACKSAIKAGDLLTQEQMKVIVSEFLATDMAYTCPHGRPVMIEFSIKDLEKLFNRSGF